MKENSLHSVSFPPTLPLPPSLCLFLTRILSYSVFLYLCLLSIHWSSPIRLGVLTSPPFPLSVHANCDFYQQSPWVKPLHLSTWSWPDDLKSLSFSLQCLSVITLLLFIFFHVTLHLHSTGLPLSGYCLCQHCVREWFQHKVTQSYSKTFFLSYNMS